MLASWRSSPTRISFAPGLLRIGANHRHVRGVEHRGLVHDDNRFAVPLLPAIREHEQFAFDGAGVLEAVFLHVLHDAVRPGQADYPVPRRLIGVAHGRGGAALAGAGQAVDDRQTFRPGCMPEGARLLAADPVVSVGVEHAFALLITEAVRTRCRQGVGRAPHMRFRLQHAARGVPDRRPAAFA
jgi:hypothetical protein